MKTLKVLSVLLCYPQVDMQAALDEMAETLDREDLLPERERRALRAFMQRLKRTDLMESQERYVATFDRGRALSLHLFEHVHGQSRDRGQAMVNLLDVYRRHGFELDARELPDYIPLFLEYLAQRPMGEALDMLADAMHVMALLGARLAERGSDYSAIFDALAALVGEPADIEDIRRQAATEGSDQTVVNMDKIWEEEAVTFLANRESCSASRTGLREAQPVQWMPRPGSTPQPARSL
ncbi:MAG: nitrate reductase molybdenum cofactor assembly chaperone [Candidatus Competibacter sp.]|nr:nitrate reductase molybdenum cofactor assembly chaperone [Candidatus Competibacter sp.]MDG4583065.1 nitrate reductase molybdenum cofactor assembly chaperone [Candidatus Competibacter sp.]